MTKDDMDLLKGFPLSIEQKERLLNLIKSNGTNGNSVNDNAYFEIYRGNGAYDIYVSIPTKTIFTEVIPSSNNIITILIEDIDFYNYIIDKTEMTVKTDIIENIILITKNNYITIDNDQYVIQFTMLDEIKLELLIRKK